LRNNGPMSTPINGVGQSDAGPPGCGCILMLKQSVGDCSRAQIQ
jgi:hypothetical protein